MLKKSIILTVFAAALVFCGCPTDPPDSEGDPDDGSNDSGYSVTYNSNEADSGTVPSYGQLFSTGDEVTVLGNTGSLVRSGYVFAGWNTASDGSGTGYNAGDTFDMGTSDVVLYAAWAEPVQLTASDGVRNDLFGLSCAMSGDYLIATSSGNGSGGLSNSGGAYVFEHADESGWVQEPKLTIDDPSANNLFGNASAIDGDYAVVGARADDLGGSSGADYGSAYVFHRSASGDWVQQEKLFSTENETDDFFGTSVSICGDYIIVGVPGMTVTRNTADYTNAGGAYIYHRDGEDWTNVAKLVVSDCNANEEYGSSVAIGDNYALVGSSNPDSSAGSVVRFLRESSPGGWDTGTEMTPVGVAEDDYFGCAVAASGDQIIVGAHRDDTTASNDGAVYIFERTNPAADIWSSGYRIANPDTDGVGGDSFGYSVAICGDRAVIGANWDNDFGVGSGTAYFAERLGFENWILTEVPTPDADSGGYFGYSAAVSSEYAAVGAYKDDVDPVDGCGSVWVFSAD